MIRLGSVFALLLLCTSAHAECTDEERAAMARRGDSARQVNAFCQLREDDFPAPAAGATATDCNTPQNFCPLPSPAPAGADCTCPSPAGPVPGVAE